MDKVPGIEYPLNVSTLPTPPIFTLMLWGRVKGNITAPY